MGLDKLKLEPSDAIEMRLRFCAFFYSFLFFYFLFFSFDSTALGTGAYRILRAYSYYGRSATA